MDVNTYQTFEGFGVSGCWWSQEIGGWQATPRKKVQKLLFDSEEGIGIEIYRYNIGAGADKEILDPWRRSKTFEIALNQYDWTRDSNSILFLNEIVKLGVKKVIAFSNSPTSRMTKSRTPTGNIDGTSNLPAEMYEDYAQYLIDVTNYLVSIGIPITHLSPINEPQWDWNVSKGQEGCHFELDEIVEFLEIIHKKMSHQNVTYDLAVIEAGEWKTADSYLKAIMSNPLLKKFLTHFDVHSYWSTEEDKKKFMDFLEDTYPKLKITMSEWTEMVSGRDVSMDSALVLAKTIWEDLTIGGVVAWHYWIGVSKYNYRDGLIYTNEGTEDIIETKRLWAMGNFSKFIKSGMVRIESESSNEVKTVAFKDSSEEQQILVVINFSESKQLIPLKKDNQYSTLLIYQTDEGNNLENIYKGVTISSFSLTPRSISTFVFSNQ